MIDDGVRKIDRHLAEALGERIANGGFGDEPQPNQNLAQRCFRFALFDQRDIQLIGRNHAAREERLAERQLGNRGVHMIHGWRNRIIDGYPAAYPRNTPIVSIAHGVYARRSGHDIPQSLSCSIDPRFGRKFLDASRHHGGIELPAGSRSRLQRLLIIVTRKRGLFQMIQTYGKIVESRRCPIPAGRRQSRPAALRPSAALRRKGCQVKSAVTPFQDVG